MTRNDYDYQLSRSRAAEDHTFDLQQIMLSGDALQYYYSQRQYNLDAQRAQQDYDTQKSRSEQDFNLQQSDSLEQFNLQRAQQIKQYNIQLADQQQNFDISNKRQAEQYAIQLDDIDYQYKLERDRRKQAFQDQIVPEIYGEAQDEAKLRAYYEGSLNQQMITDFDKLMSKYDSQWGGFMAGYQASDGGGGSSSNDGGGGISTNAPAQSFHSNIPGMNNGTYTGTVQGLTSWLKQNNWVVDVSKAPGMSGYAMGGYTKGGPAVLHDDEFVMTRATTKYAEDVAKGTLTQDKILSMLSGGGGFTYNDSRVFSRGLDSTEHQQIEAETRQMVMEAFR
jgi:hypothetical protein